jgi:hypothetical protein
VESRSGDAPNVEEINVPADGWKIGVAIRSSYAVLVVGWYSPAQEFQPKQALPDVDELVKRYGAYP